MNQDNQRQAVLFAYIAGLMDGEGTIRINRVTWSKHPNWNIRYSGAISIGMTDQKAIELFVELFGSKMRIERVPNRKVIYRWGTSGNIVVPKILKQFLPYLRVKKKQAELVIKYCENCMRKGFQKSDGLPKKELQWREALYNKVKNLNH